MRKVKPLFAVVSVLVLLGTINASAQQAAGEPPEVSRAQLADVIAAQERHTAELLGHPAALGTGVSVDATGRGVIKVYTRSVDVRGLPRRLDGYPVVAEYVGSFVALQRPPQANGNGNGKGKGNGDNGGTFDRTARHRPAPIGVSTGHPDITAGTVGARVEDAAGNVYALSNNHVYANLNAANIGDNVLQPGTFDGGVNPDDAFGTLWDFNRLGFGVFDVNVIDAAIALTSTAELGNATPPDGYGVPKSQTLPAAVNMRVMKYGRTTGLTKARVSDINVFTIVQYGPDFFLWFDQQILISGGGFSAGGDSGSLVVGARGSDTGKPVGLLFAGSTTTTLANPIDAVLAEFGVVIDGQ